MNTWDLFSEGNEKPTPHEKFKRGIKSAGYDMDAGAKRLEDLLAKQKAERDAREKEEQKNVSEEFTGYWKGTDKGTPGRKMVGADESVNKGEVDYDDDYQDMVRRVGEKAKAADALKAQGKQPQTKFNPKTGRYYVDHGQASPVKENAEELNIGDPVIITGNVEFEGTTGDIIAFGQDKRFVIVNLYNHGKHSFHSSDVSFNDYADSDEEEARMQEAGYGRNRGYHQGFASPHAPRLGGRREDDEYINGPDPVDTTTWYIRANGKIIKDKMGTPYHFRDKEAATKAARTMMAKSFNAGKKFMLTTKPVDDQPENEARLNTEYKRNRFSGITQRDQAQDQASKSAMNRVRDEVDEAIMEGSKQSPEKEIERLKLRQDAEHGGASLKRQAATQARIRELEKQIKDKQGVTEAFGLYGPFTVTINTGERPQSRTKTKKFRREDDAILWAQDWLEDAPQYVFATAEVTDPDGNVVWTTDEQGMAEGSGNWYVRVKGKVLKDKKFDAIPFPSQESARLKAMEIHNKKRIPLDMIKLTQSWMDGPETQGVAEDWKSALGGAALAGAMAIGGTAHAQSGEDFLPDIVAHVTFKVDGNTVKKDINLGTAFKSPGEASAALEKFLKAKGIKYFDYSLERVKSKDNNYLEKTPAVDTGHAGSIDSDPYRATGGNNDYMAKESIDEAVDRAAKSMMEDGYEFTEGWSQKYKSSINCSHPKGFSQKAHCAGKKKHNESIEMEMVCEDCGMCETHGNLNEIKKGQKDSNGVTKCWSGYHAAGTKKSATTGKQVRNCVPNEGVAEAKHGLYYNVNKRKKAGTSRDASSPKAPTAQAWKDAAKTAKKTS